MNITFSFLNSWRPTPRGRSGTCRSSFEGRAWSIQNVSDWGRACFTSQTRPPSAMTAGSVQVRREPPVLRGTLPRLFLTPFMSLAMRQQPGHPIPARSIDADGVARHQGRQRFGLWACLGAWGAGTAGHLRTLARPFILPQAGCRSWRKGLDAWSSWGLPPSRGAAAAAQQPAVPQMGHGTSVFLLPCPNLARDMVGLPSRLPSSCLLFSRGDLR
jgi:hypothetical protein